MAMKKINDPVKERRNGERAVRVVAVRHRLIKRGAKKLDAIWSLSTTKNMSISGALFMSPVEYKKNDFLDLEIVMSGVIDIYKGKAEVVRAVQSGPSFDVAVKYIKLEQKKPVSRSAKKHGKK